MFDIYLGLMTHNELLSIHTGINYQKLSVFKRYKTYFHLENYYPLLPGHGFCEFLSKTFADFCT